MMDDGKGIGRGHDPVQLRRETSGVRNWARGGGGGADEGSRKAERRTKKDVRRGAGRVLPDRCAKAKENERKMLHPSAASRCACPGDQPVLEGTVLTLDHTVSLRVVRGCELAGDAQRPRQFQPQVRGELPPPVSNDGVRNSKAGHPLTQEGPRRCLLYTSDAADE